MSVIIFEHVKGIDLVNTLKKIQPDPNQTFKIIVETENEHQKEDMPSEEMISDELIKAVKCSEESYTAGRGVTCKNKEESEKFFKKIWDEKI